MKKKRQEEEEFEEEKKGHGFVILVSILILIIIGGGTFAGFYFYNSSSSGKSSKVMRAYVSIGEVQVKLSDDSGKRYVKANVAVGYDDKLFNKAKKQLQKDKQLPVVLDAVSFDLMQKNSSYFNGDYEDNLKSELIDAVNKKVQDFKITDIKISNVIVQ